MKRADYLNYGILHILYNKTQPHLKDLKRIAKILDVDIRELLVPTKDKN
jgi:transcriptional regulator with XRE-family HTH domain